MSELRRDEQDEALTSGGAPMENLFTPRVAMRGEICQGPSMEIRRISQFEDVKLAGHLFDEPPKEQATERFLADGGHHLLIAYLDGRPAGMVTGVEMTHPDKGTEMFLYELGVDEEMQGLGIGTALVSALADLARERDCFGMWVVTGGDNEAAQRTYAGGGGMPEQDQVVFVWDFEQV